MNYFGIPGTAVGDGKLQWLKGFEKCMNHLISSPAILCLSTKKVDLLGNFWDNRWAMANPTTPWEVGLDSITDLFV